MAIEFKDYYKTLGVSKTATEDEIRKAFRKLARQYHPDVSGNKPGAEDKFKEINEAYEVLSDPEKRKKYDTLGPSWRQGPSQGPQGWGPGPRPGRTRMDASDFEFSGTGFSDFFEQLFGARGGGMGGGSRAGGGRSRTFTEEDFAEDGDDVEADLMVTLEEVAKGSVRTISLRRSSVCQKCYGVGKVNGQPCDACDGRGHIDRTDSHKIKIPVGIREGQSLRVPGQGEPGRNGGRAGDLFLRIRLARHPDFRVEGSDLHYELDIAPWEAALGASISVPTLDGNVSIKIPPGTGTGQKLRVRGRGLKGRDASSAGDLIVVTKVQTPAAKTDEEKKLWEQLAKASSFNPRD